MLVDFPVVLVLDLPVADLEVDEPALALEPVLLDDVPALLVAFLFEPEEPEVPEDMLPEPDWPIELAAFIEADMLLPGSLDDEEDFDPPPIEALEPEVLDD